MTEIEYIRQYLKGLDNFLGKGCSANDFETWYLQKYKSDDFVASNDVEHALSYLFGEVDAFCSDESIRGEDDINEDQLVAAVEKTVNILNKAAT